MTTNTSSQTIAGDEESAENVRRNVGGLITPGSTPDPRDTPQSSDVQDDDARKPDADAKVASTITNIEKIILSGVTSVEIVQKGDTGVVQTPGTTPAQNQDEDSASSDRPKPQKKYLLKLRYRTEESLETGVVTSSKAHEKKVEDPEVEVPILEVVYQIVKSSVLQITLSETTKLKILSPLLLNALRWVVAYSDESLDGDTVQIPAPYKLLHNYREELEAFKNEHPPTHSPEYVKECNSHIDFLLDFLRRHEGSRWQEIERARWTKEEPTTTWKNLWLLLRPGDEMIVKREDYFAPYILQWMYGGFVKSKAEDYNLGLWNVDFDGEYFGRSLFTTEIKPFDGEVAIRSLKVYPAKYHPGWDKLKEQFITRGKKFVKTVSDYSYKEYTGRTIEGARRDYVKERIVFDYSFEPWISAEFKDRHKPHLNEIYGNYMGGKICLCDACLEADEMNNKTVRPVFADLDLVKPAETASWTGDREQIYGLCAPVVYGYILKERRWRIFDIEKVHEPSFNPEVMDTLVMDPSKKQIIKAICNEYTREDGTSDAFAADQIRGKGNGRIFLLHGPPGVGKTLTAECVAENTRRPLLSITAGDVGISAERVEDNLERYFKWAQDWRAILLMDEADVFLETREKRDLERNSVVSVFLRALEYYSGILFITTNRIGSFDEAFKSRMHISIHYNGLDDNQRKEVWRNNFKKLKKDKKNIIWDEDVLDYVLTDPDVRRLKWNGRDIRNCFQTAVTLAEYEANQERASEVRFKTPHLEKVIDMSKKFAKYLEEAHHGQDDATVARDRGIRADSFDEQHDGEGDRDDYNDRSRFTRRRQPR